MVFSGLQVLTQCQHIDVMRAQIIHAALQLVLPLAQPEHQRSLGYHLWAISFPVLQHIKRLLITGSRIANGTYELHKSLERRVADFYGKKCAVVFSTLDLAQDACRERA